MNEQYKYPREAPHWIQAAFVQAATPDGSHVHVRLNDNEHETYRMCRVGWHNPYMDKAKSDVDVETQEYGWLRIWFHNGDVQPFKEVKP